MSKPKIFGGDFRIKCLLNNASCQKFLFLLQTSPSFLLRESLQLFRPFSF